MEKYPYVVYILISSIADKFYIGHTNNINRRLKEHNDKDNKSWTKSYQPWKILHTEGCSTRAEAMKLEKYLKSLKNKSRIREYIAGWRSSISGGS